MDTNRLENRIKEIKKAQKVKELDNVIIKRIDERKILRSKQKINTEPKLEISLRKLENMADKTSTIIIGRVGLTVSIENMRKISLMNIIRFLFYWKMLLITNLQKH